MESIFDLSGLPNSKSPSLHLTQPTPNECAKIWSNTAASWRDALTGSDYLQEQLFLTTVPLAKENGMTTWILVEKNDLPDQRRILCSCETYLKRSLMSDASGKVEDVIVHGIASVFCPADLRRRGYGARFMSELAKALRTWRADRARVAGSVLYSDIGRDYYAPHGWQPNPTNWHVGLPPRKTSTSSQTQEVVEDNLAELCQKDETIVRAAMAAPTDGVKKRVTVLPDLDHMLWHIAKENFITERLFGKIPRSKGAIAGSSGNQVWAIWTHRYYGHLDAESPGNVLYILRLVVEGDDSANKPQNTVGRENGVRVAMQEEKGAALVAVLQHAQAEAAEWRLDQVKLWEPTPWVLDVIMNSNISYSVAKREKDSVACCLWYDENGGTEAAPAWINNEHYAWC